MAHADSAATTGGSAATGAAGSTIRVGIKPLDPFVTCASSPSECAGGQPDRYSGFSIDLWTEIARRADWQTTYVWHEALAPLLKDVESSTVDVGIAGISITRDREQVLDFSYPMFNAGLEVMTSTRGGGLGWTHELTSVALGVGRYVAALVVILIAAGHVVWLATRRRTGHGYLPGVGLGVYRAAGLGLSGDFGVGDPVAPIARVVAVVWVILGICFVAVFTGAVTSQLTVSSFRSKISGVQDLSGSRVVTVAGTSSERYLQAHSLRYNTVATIDQAYVELDSGRAEAIVFDAPVLEHRVQVTGGGSEIVVGGTFAREDYGIAVPAGSPLRKLINTTLLDLHADGTYDQLYARYFGQQPGS